MGGAGREIHHDIDIAVGTKMIGGDRTEDLEFFDALYPAKLLDLFLPAPDECVSSVSGNYLEFPDSSMCHDKLSVDRTCSGEKILFRELWVHCPHNQE